MKKQNMNFRLSKTSALTASMVLLGSLVSGSDAAVTAVVQVDSSSQLTVTLSGELSGATPDRFPMEMSIRFGIDTPHANAVFPISMTGDFNVGGTTGILYNAVTPFKFSISIINNAALTTGQFVNGTSTYVYSVAHEIPIGEDFDVYWGGNSGAFQSSGIVSIPEPTSLLFLGSGLLAAAKRSRIK